MRNLTLGLRRFILSSLFATAVGSWQATAQPAPVDPADVTGIVLDEVGEPVVGASVFVESARPRQGSASSCPTCYPDCGKQAKTNAKGEFTIPGMDSNLIYRFLLMAKGYEATAKDKIDPFNSPLSLALWKRPPLADNQKTINARIYDPNGKAVLGALVEIEGAETGNMTTWGGHGKYIQGLGVSDDSGVMSLLCSSELKAGLGVLQARGFARQWVRLVPGKDQIFVLREGVLVTGQVVKDGKAVSGLRVGFNGSDRMAGEYFRGWEVVTDAQGAFSFPNLTANKEFTIYGSAKTAAKLGLLPSRSLKMGADGSKLDLGKIEVQTPLHIRGKVFMDDGEPAFPGSKIGLSREQAGDYREANLNEEGAFQFDGLGPEMVEITLRMSGYKFSKKNPNRLNGRSIGGHLQQSIEDFIIVLEQIPPGEDPYNDGDNNWQARETPLRSATK